MWESRFVRLPRDGRGGRKIRPKLLNRPGMVGETTTVSETQLGLRRGVFCLFVFVCFVCLCLFLCVFVCFCVFLCVFVRFRFCLFTSFISVGLSLQ